MGAADKKCKADLWDQIKNKPKEERKQIVDLTVEQIDELNTEINYIGRDGSKLKSMADIAGFIGANFIKGGTTEREKFWACEKANVFAACFGETPSSSSGSS